MRWAFQIERTTLDRRNLFDLIDSLGYPTGGRFRTSRSVLWSTSLEACTDAGEVWEEAKLVRELVSEVTEIDPEFVLGPVLDLSSGVPKTTPLPRGRTDHHQNERGYCDIDRVSSRPSICRTACRVE